MRRNGVWRDWESGGNAIKPVEVLMLSYYYPPMDFAGTRRITAFVKYLPAQGYRPVVLTSNSRGALDSDRVEGVFRAREVLDLLKQPYRALKLRHLPAERRWLAPALAAQSPLARLLHHMLIPDMLVTWYPLALRKGLKLLRQRPIQLIYSTSPCETTHLVARRLKLLTGLPWVADFRDGWMFEPPNPVRLAHPLRRSIEAMLERRVLLTADRLVTVNKTIADDFIQRYPQVAQRVMVIPNGYDPEHFAARHRGPETASQLRIVHTGSLTFSRAQTSLTGLLAALRNLRDSFPHVSKDMTVEFIGNIAREEEHAVTLTGLDSQITLRGSVVHEEALQAQTDADVLLLVTVPGKSSVTTSKIFEYLAHGHPILALTGDSPAAELIRELDAGLVVPPDDAVAIEQALITLHSRWRAGTLTTQRNPQVAQYSRPVLTAKLAQCFSQVQA